MSITDIVGQTAATNPTVGMAVALAQTQSSLLASLADPESPDALLSSLLSAQSDEQDQINAMIAQLTPNVGQNVDTTA